jgi:hypothetical protein
MELKNKRHDDNGNLVYYEKYNGDTRSFTYDDRNRLTYYGENGEYDMWKHYSIDGGYCFMYDNRGNKKYFKISCNNVDREISEDEFNIAIYEESFNPDIFKFELMEI